MQQTTAISAGLILNVIEGLGLVIAFAFAAIGASAIRRSMPYRVWYWPLEAALAVAVGAGAYLITGVRAAPLYLLIAAAAGLVMGLGAGLAARPWAAAGRLVFRRSGIGWFVLVSSHGLLSATAWWTLKPFMSAALGVVAWATALLVGDDAGHLLKGAVWSRRIGRIAMAPQHRPGEEATGGVAGPEAGSQAGLAAGAAERPALDARPRWAWDLAEGRAFRPAKVEEKPRRRGLVKRLRGQSRPGGRPPK